jgi:hypothetical protein
MAGRNAATIALKLAAIAAACLTQVGCGSPPAAYQDTRSGDGRYVCHVTEYDDPEGDVGRILDLHITLDGSPVLKHSYFGNKRWSGKAVRFAVGKTGRFYHLFVVGHPGYAVGAVDGGSGAVWFQSTNERSEHIIRAFEAEAGRPRLTDLNWLNGFVLSAGPGG